VTRIRDSRPGAGSFARFTLLLLVTACQTQPDQGAREPVRSAPSGATSASAGREPEFADCLHPRVRRDCRDGFCKIPSGCFLYGSPSSEEGRARHDEDQVRVTLTRAFEIQETELTLGAWAKAGFEFPNLAIAPSTNACTDPRCPVKNATFYQALEYANWLSKQRGLEPCFALKACARRTDQPGFGAACEVELRAPSIYECRGYRLPTSAEWEYAARAGTSTEYYSGKMTSFPASERCGRDPNLLGVAHYCANVAEPREQPVATLAPNAWGVYDTLGNVFEWVMDRHRGLPLSDPQVDPGAELDVSGSGMRRSCRVNNAPKLCRVASKLQSSRDARDAGFRLARTLFD